MGAPPPAITFFDTDISDFATSPSMQAHLQALQLVQQEVWKPVAAAYQKEVESLFVPHPFMIGNTVWVRRHQIKNLEPRWKGPLYCTSDYPYGIEGRRHCGLGPRLTR